MGSVSNIPLKEKYQICLLCLNPEEHSGTFIYESIEGHDRCVFEVHPVAGLVGAELQSLKPGGVFESLIVDASHLPSDLIRQAQRTVEKEYESWTELCRVDRLHLQCHWVKEMIRRTEEDLLRAIDRPHTDATVPRWNTAGLCVIIDNLSKLTAQFEGLSVALNSM